MSLTGGHVVFELKLLTREAIPAALEKAHRYRLVRTTTNRFDVWCKPH